MGQTLSAEEYAARSASAYERALRAQLVAHGVPRQDPDGLGRRAAAAAAAGQAWADDAGPFTDTEGVRKLLGGVTKQAVSQRLRQRRLLGLLLATDGTARDHLVYPLWQFRPSVLGALPKVLAAAGFDPDRPVTGWTIAHWLTNTSEALGGFAPIQLLESGHDGHVILAAAEVAQSLGVDERAAARHELAVS